MTMVLDGEHLCTMNPDDAETAKLALGYADHDKLISSSDKP
jgi:hypothetical protein